MRGYLRGRRREGLRGGRFLVLLAKCMGGAWGGGSAALVFGLCWPSLCFVGDKVTCVAGCRDG